FFKKNDTYDLVFMDIHLADGNSFEIVREVEPTAPIIFTTAYDQYAIQAFKLNSIDYLLKPIRETELKNSILKFKDAHQKMLFSSGQIEALISLMNSPKKKYRSSFLIQKRDTFVPVASKDFAFFFIQNGVVRGKTIHDQILSFNEKLEDLENELNPEFFFRANRQYLIQRSAVKSLQSYFNGRLLVHLEPQPEEQIIVSKANASRLKLWLNDAKQNNFFD
ncbi:MAG: LytTR family DNA-binding domain-containing protein, partial [Bacteroidota bacterium]